MFHQQLLLWENRRVKNEMNSTIVNNLVVVLFAVSMLVLCFLPDIIALKLIKIIVPEYVLWNKNAELECRYTLENDEKLYRVQWYKDDDEFYRFDQKSNPRQFTYPIDEIKVDKSQSNEKKVILRNVNLMMRGIYKCEVSAEAPSFCTVYGEALMEIIATPKEGPSIEGEEKTYQIGDTINLTCTSGKSFPAARLRWFINSYEFPTRYETVREPNGLMSSKSTISLKAGPEHFIKNHIQIKCQASISVGNHSVITLPVQHGKHHDQSPSSKPNYYQKDALISVTGSAVKIVPNVIIGIEPLLLCILLYDIT